MLGITRLKYLGEDLIRCLDCGELSFKIVFYIYEAPLVGEVLIEHGYCTLCEFRRSDVSVINYGKPKTIKIKVKSVDDLKIIVIKSSSSSIEIPELGIEINPGIAAPGYITTVEGILERVLDVIPSDCELRKECLDEVNLIKKAMNGLVEFTLIIKDPLGRSAVIYEEGRNNVVIEEYVESQ